MPFTPTSAPGTVRYEELIARTHESAPALVEGDVSTDDPRWVHVDTDEGLVSIPISNVIRIDWKERR